MIVDRESRDRLVQAIADYLGDRITAFEFDDRIFAISDVTQDSTVSDIVLTLWSLYDDVKDHKVVLSKQEWDFIQRLVLILQSDALLEVSRTRTWSLAQPFAAVGLILFGLCAVWFGVGSHLLVVAIPFGILSIVLHKLFGQLRDSSSPAEVAMVPFRSISELVHLYRRVAEFRKTKYRRELEGRTIRTNFNFDTSVLMNVLWLPVGPLALLIQTLPPVTSEIRVVVPNS